MPSNTAVEGDTEPWVTNITDTIDNHYHYQDIINKQVGQICMFIPIEIKVTIIPVTIIVMDIIQFHLLETHVIQIITHLIALVICNTVQWTCTLLIHQICQAHYKVRF